MIPASMAVAYGSYRPQMDKLLNFVYNRLKADLGELNVVSISARPKSVESTFQKLQTGKYSSMGDVKDLVGLTVVLLYRKEVFSAIELVKSSGLQYGEEPPRAVSASDFKYRQPKLYVGPAEDYLERNPELQGLVAEVQFTTALQHALDMTTHDFDYKGQSYSWSNFRLVAQLRGMLELVDGMIDDIGSVSLAREEFVQAPEEFEFASQMLRVLEGRFAGAPLPADRRRFADTVAQWAKAVGFDAPALDDLLGRHSHLLAANSVDATSAVLAALLSEKSSELLEGYPERLVITSELESLCQQANQVPGDRRVVITSSTPKIQTTV